MKTFGAYKDSGVDGIGDIPNHWEPVRLKYLASVQTGRTPKIQSSQVDFFENGDTNWFTPADFDGYGDLRESKRKINANALDEKEVELFPENSIYLVSIGATLGRVGMCMTKASANQQINVISFSQEKCDARFGFYFLQGNSQMVSIEADYTTLPILNQTKTKNLRLVVPKLAEQTAIAAYLDRKTAEIDELIESKRRLLELYEEEKTAIINQAVTRGINPDAPMKDSGIDWLGEVPAHWEVKKVKHLLKKKKGALKTGPFGSQLKTSDLVPDGPYKVYNQRHVLNNWFHDGEDRIDEAKFANLREFLVENDDILFTSRGTIGKCAVFPSNCAKGVLHPCLIRIQIDDRLVIAQWVLRYVNDSSFFIDNVRFESNTTIIEVIYGATLKEIIMPVPPVVEQRTILKYIETESHRIDTQKARTQKLIDLLTEYRTALISEVVTGKVKVA